MIVEDDGFETQALPRRLGSSQYRILPSIGQMSHTEASADEANSRTVLDGQKARRTAKPSDRKNVNAGDKPITKSHSRLQNHIKVAGKCSSNVESESLVNQGGGDSRTPEPPMSLVDQQVVLAVKLPSGQRIEHPFQSTDKLSDVLHYVEVVTQQDFTNCEFVTADRKTVLNDLNVTIASSGVLNRSVLYLQLPDET